MIRVAAFYNRASIKNEAGAWIVRLDRGELSREETVSFREWLSRGNFHRQYIDKLARNWDSMSVLQELAELFPLSAQEPAAESHPMRARLFNYLRPAVVAGPAVAICALLVTLFISEPSVTRHLVTQIGERATYELEDGSQVQLNTNSRLDVDFSKKLRTVRLGRGEASFNVVKNPQRPFVVYAGQGMVMAIGTAFNVRYTSAIVDVTVTEGAVRVVARAESRPTRRSIRLNPIPTAKPWLGPANLFSMTNKSGCRHRQCKRRSIRKPPGSKGGSSFAANLWNKFYRKFPATPISRS